MAKALGRQTGVPYGLRRKWCFNKDYVGAGRTRFPDTFQELLRNEKIFFLFVLRNDIILFLKSLGGRQRKGEPILAKYAEIINNTFLWGWAQRLPTSIWRARDSPNSDSPWHVSRRVRFRLCNRITEEMCASRIFSAVTEFRLQRSLAVNEILLLRRNHLRWREAAWHDGEEQGCWETVAWGRIRNSAGPSLGKCHLASRRLSGDSKRAMGLDGVRWAFPGCQPLLLLTTSSLPKAILALEEVCCRFLTLGHLPRSTHPTDSFSLLFSFSFIQHVQSTCHLSDRGSWFSQKEKIIVSALK